MHQTAELLSEHQQLKDPLSSQEPGAAAVVAPHPTEDPVRRHTREQMPDRASHRQWLFASLADLSHQALREDTGDRRREQIREI